MFIEFKETWFKQESTNIWNESNKYIFEDMKSDNIDFYELYDKSRNVILFLRKDGKQCLINDQILYTNDSTVVNKRIKYVHPNVYNKGSKIAVVMMYTPNLANICSYSEANIIAYCNKHKYTCYIYKDSMTDSHPTWNKPLVIKDNIEKHEFIMWIDSDAIFTNFDIKIEEIIAKEPEKSLLVCNDIGRWKINAGVQIWKNCDWSVQTLNEWWNMKHLDHIQGGDQGQLIQLLIKKDLNEEIYHIFDQTEFNCHPKKHKPGMFILHMMGMSGDYRIKSLKYWNEKNKVM